MAIINFSKKKGPSKKKIKPKINKQKKKTSFLKKKAPKARKVSKPAVKTKKIKSPIKAAARRSLKRSKPNLSKYTPSPDEKFVGKITHYFPKVKAAVIKISDGSLSLKDTIRLKGHTTDFKQNIVSMQIDRRPIEKAQKPDEIGLRVNQRVRINDQVYKLL